MGKLYKSLALIALAFFAFSLIIGCGGGSSGGDSSSAPTYSPTYTPTTTPTSSETGTVRGQVFDDAGKPLANATVTTNIYGQEQSSRAQTTTDSEGKFTLTGVPVGYQQMTVYNGNYSKTLDIEVQQNSIIDVGNIAALPSGTINGIVVDTSDNPIPFALVELTVEAEIPVPTPTSSPTVTPTTSPTITPTTSPTITPTFSPTPTGSGKIQGYVEEFLTAVPIQGVTMKLDGTASATTDGSGQYAIENVSSGIHLVTTEHSGYYSTNVTVIVENNMTTYYNFILYSTGSFQGRQARYTMYLYAISDMEGKFSFPFVPDGDYTLRGNAYGYTEGTASTTVESGVSADVKIVLGGDGPGPLPTPTITPTSSPTITPTSSPSPSPTTTPTGTLRVVAYGYEDSDNNGEFVSVKHIRVREYGNSSVHWFNNWPHYSHETPYELNCTGAKLNRYYVVEVEWHNGHDVIIDTVYLDYDGETVWVSYYAKDKQKKTK